MSNVAKALQNLYCRGDVNKTGLKRAVSDGVITPAEYQEITGEAYTEG